MTSALVAANLGLPAPLIATVALLVAMAVCMYARVLHRAHRVPAAAQRAARLAPLITAIGVSILLQTVAMLIWGRRYHTVPSDSSAYAA